MKNEGVLAEVHTALSRETDTPKVTNEIVASRISKTSHVSVKEVN